MATADDVRREVLGLSAQAVVFVIGLCVSLGIGMLLAAHTDGPGLLIVVTLVAGFGLLGAAMLSQIVRDRITHGSEAEDL
jgi:hypothetical protein